MTNATGFTPYDHQNRQEGPLLALTKEQFFKLWCGSPDEVHRRLSGIMFMWKEPHFHMFMGPGGYLVSKNMRTDW